MAKSTRRKFLFNSLKVFGVGAIVLWLTKNSILKWIIQSTNNEGLVMDSAPKIGDNMCILTSGQGEGPFFISSPIRRDIVEDRVGKMMNFKMQVLKIPDCTPVENAIVEIWHCDAEGNYSGYPEEITHDIWKIMMFLKKNSENIGDNIKPVSDARYLRGAQQSDANGMVEFNTIFPGWYEGRAPHIHFKIIANENEQITSQFYFKPEFCDDIYLNTEPYKAYGKSPYTIHNDGVIHEDITAVTGLLLNPTMHNQTIESVVKVGVQSSLS